MTDKFKNSIIRYLNTEYGDMSTFIHKNQPEYLFHLKGLKILFEYDYILYGLKVDNEVWNVLQNFMGLEFEEVRTLLIKWFSDKYKLKVSGCVRIKKSYRWSLIELYHTNHLVGYDY
jgi:hypothetical protein